MLLLLLLITADSLTTAVFSQLHGHTPGYISPPPGDSLPLVKQRIEFKLCLLVHKSLIGHSPAYISDLLTSAADVPRRPALRTASRGDFIVPRTNRKFGDREFCVAAPRVWNRLPTDLRQLRSTQTFRRHLKTVLFAASY